MLPPAMDEYLESNRALWDEWTDLHEGSAFYDLEGFRRGGVRVRPEEIEEVGDVAGKTLLHVQCHFGLDTLSWARLGATVTGADFSPKAIALATRLAEELGLADRARFVRSSVDDLPANLDGAFDVVYTSRGVLYWLPDLSRWAEVVAGFVRPGGTFYLMEVHPVALVFEDEADDLEPDELRLRYPYFTTREPLRFDVRGSYADPTATVKHPVEYGWPHGLGEIVTAVAGAGLRIETLREYLFTEWPLPFLVPTGPGHRHGFPAGQQGELPLTFSLRATKPA
jgi:SAM-dependent methyltransferase